LIDPARAGCGASKIKLLLNRQEAAGVGFYDKFLLTKISNQRGEAAITAFRPSYLVLIDIYN